MPVKPVDARERTITEEMSFRDILLLVGGVQEMQRDGEVYISLKRGLESIKNAVRKKTIFYTELNIVIAALYRASQTDTFYETPEEVGRLIRGLNEFIGGIKVGIVIGIDATSNIARVALSGK